MKEIWKDIPGWEGYYQVSNKGRIFGIKTKKIRKLHVNKKNRVGLVLSKPGMPNQPKKVSRLVMLAFKGASDLHVDHINNNPLDNRLENLRYCTRSENNTINRHHVGVSKIRNISWDSRYKSFVFNMFINNVFYRCSKRKTIKQCALDYYIFKKKWGKKFPGRFKDHPIEKLYPIDR